MLLYPEAQYTILRHGDGLGIDLAIGAAMPGLTPGPTTYVSVDDVDAYVGKLAQVEGVAIVQPPYDIEGRGLGNLPDDGEDAFIHVSLSSVKAWRASATKIGSSTTFRARPEQLGLS